MRVRIIKPFFFKKRNVSYKPGEVVDAPREDAEVWLKAGIAMQDKSVEPAETKAEEKEKAPPKRTRKTKAKK